jgi:hypothetical protein
MDVKIMQAISALKLSQLGFSTLFCKSFFNVSNFHLCYFQLMKITS